MANIHSDELTHVPFSALTGTEKRARQLEIFQVFIKLGTVAFGGPAAHIALMETEIVQKRQWLSRETFMDLLGATNLIPGPNSTELAIHLGYERGGGLGLMIAGISFILPAMLIVLLCAVGYAEYGALPEATALLYGVKPIIIAIIVQALIRLGQTQLKSRLNWAVAILLGLLSLFVGVAEIPLLLISGLFFMVYANRELLKHKFFSLNLLPAALVFTKAGQAVQTGISKIQTEQIFFIFLKIGSVLYGSGYVLIAFLESELVHKLGVLSNQQLLDAVAIGQFTPGPVFTTATFVGYLMGGFGGAIAATVGIFLPAFVLVWLLNPFISKLRQSTWFSGILDGVNLGSLVLMAVVTIKLGQATLVDPLAIILMCGAYVLLAKFKVNATWLILGGAGIGLLASIL